MIKNRPYVIYLNNWECEMAEKFAKAVELGGRSQIRTYDRQVTLSEDNGTGQFGEAALSKFLTSTILVYIKTREEKAKNPYQGDGGCDLMGYRIDVKTSRMRKGENYLYHLHIRNGEYHPNNAYVLGLMDVRLNDRVYLIGWEEGKNFPEPDKHGRRSIVMDDLRPMDELLLNVNRYKGI